MKLWFKAKTYGYGWTPCSWEGWLVLAVYLALTFITVAVIDSYSLSERASAMIFIPLAIIYTSVLLFTCVRTGEKARWRWGE